MHMYVSALFMCMCMTGQDVWRHTYVMLLSHKTRVSSVNNPHEPYHLLRVVYTSVTRVSLVHATSQETSRHCHSTIYTGNHPISYRQIYTCMYGAHIVYILGGVTYMSNTITNKLNFFETNKFQDILTLGLNRRIKRP